MYALVFVVVWKHCVKLTLTQCPVGYYSDFSFELVDILLKNITKSTKRYLKKVQRVHLC